MIWLHPYTYRNFINRVEYLGPIAGFAEICHGVAYFRDVALGSDSSGKVSIDDVRGETPEDYAVMNELCEYLALPGDPVRQLRDAVKLARLSQAHRIFLPES